MSDKKRMPHLTFYIPHDSAKCLRLYALSQDMNMSDVIRSITRNWLKDNCLTEEILKKQIFQKLNDEWTKRRFIDPEASLDDFVQEMKKGMARRLGLTDTLCLMEEWKSKMKP